MSELPLNKVCESVFTGLAPRLKATADEVAELVSLVGVRSLSHDGWLDLTKLEQFELPEKGSVSGQQLRREDVLLAIRGSSPKVGIVEGDFPEVTYASGNLVVLRPNPRIIAPGFLWAYLKSICEQERHFILNRASTGQLSIRMKDLMALQISMPELPKQKKIANAVLAMRNIILEHRNCLLKGVECYSGLLREVFRG